MNAKKQKSAEGFGQKNKNNGEQSTQKTA